MGKPEKNLPIGIDNFEKLRTNNFYYVDKTGLIANLLNNWCEVTLFTRPRRFGKSLNMSMLEAFFSPESDKTIFDGLKITTESDLCDQYMGKYPVIFISLKSVNAPSFDIAYKMAAGIIREAAMHVEAVIQYDNGLSRADREDLAELTSRRMDEAVFYESLYTLSRILKKHYGREAIILIDEYDVPLAKAYEQGYYDEMVILIRNLFEKGLKSNSSLRMAVLTGCMRVSRESIFTGLNNLMVLGVSDARSDEFFGFRDDEVRELLDYYNLSNRYEDVKEWYDGYRFGNVNVYCPWDVINYCSYARFNPDPFPDNYWINSSGNNIVRKFIEQSGNASLKNEIEALVNGEAVEKTIRQELTYEDMYANIDNLWSVLFTTGYLTQKGRTDGRRLRLVIPNLEIRSIFEDQIMELFRKNVAADSASRDRFCIAFAMGDCQTAEESFNHYLERTISIRDTFTAAKENFYHGILIGILGTMDSWEVSSNQESGRGYSDIIIRDSTRKLAIVIEVKYAGDGKLDPAALNALKQIEDRKYDESLKGSKFGRILKYGIACYQKECRVLMSE